MQSSKPSQCSSNAFPTMSNGLTLLCCTLSLLASQFQTVLPSNCSAATGRIKHVILKVLLTSFLSPPTARANFSLRKLMKLQGLPLFWYHSPFYQSSFVTSNFLSLSVSISLRPTHGLLTRHNFMLQCKLKSKDLSILSRASNLSDKYLFNI